MILTNTIIHLLGFPGTGKYTIAKELVSLDDFALVDNHLINNPVFSLIDPDGETKLPARVWDNTAKIWDVVFDTMAHISKAQKNFILTNALFDDTPRDAEFYQKILKLAQERNAKYVPVKLCCDAEELLKRIVGEDRRQRFKETSIKNAQYNIENRAVIKIDHPNLLNLDITDLTPDQSAKKIMSHCIAIESK